MSSFILRSPVCLCRLWNRSRIVTTIPFCNGCKIFLKISCPFSTIEECRLVFRNWDKLIPNNFSYFFVSNYCLHIVHHFSYLWTCKTLINTTLNGQYSWEYCPWIFSSSHVNFTPSSAINSSLCLHVASRRQVVSVGVTWREWSSLSSLL